ncbi:hypothetical protein BDA96_04G174600 [Sorghum bicolor]|uniref:EDR1/CTR1/ARMC3-like peptidase-like domain-containing protein n=1 Tax=Sorghum bicolor TaxID=4558 RepID=A0A921R4T1_SORBI|nr:hypothetical protein BDA96_04G174600 [Sorghum bicolor]
MMKDAKWPHAAASVGGARAGPSAASSSSAAGPSYTSSRPPSPPRQHDGCSPTTLPRRLPFQHQPHRNSPNSVSRIGCGCSGSPAGAALGPTTARYPPPSPPPWPTPQSKGQQGRRGPPADSSSKSWAQQAEEAYHLQLALALRLCSEASSATDPNFLDSSTAAAADHLQHIASPQSLSHRFWVNGSLSYSDKVPDGFYLIQGMDPFIWTLCNDVHDGGRAVNPTDSAIEVVIVDKVADYDLRQLISMAIDVSRNRADSKEIASRLAAVVSTKMG